MALPDRGRDLQTVVDAVLKSKQLRLRYRHFDGRLSRSERIDPLSIAVYDHQLYVIARRTTGEYKPFRFSRIEKVDATGKTFRYPDANEYDPRALFRNSFGIWHQPDERVHRIRVRLHKRWTTYAHSHRWCDGQRVEDTPRGVVVEMNACICPELVAWVLSFGDEAEVLDPPELRRQVGERITRVVERHRRKRKKR